MSAGCGFEDVSGERVCHPLSRTEPSACILDDWGGPCQPSRPSFFIQQLQRSFRFPLQPPTPGSLPSIRPLAGNTGGPQFVPRVCPPGEGTFLPTVAKGLYPLASACSDLAGFPRPNSVHSFATAMPPEMWEPSPWVYPICFFWLEE